MFQLFGNQAKRRTAEIETKPKSSMRRLYITCFSRIVATAQLHWQGVEREDTSVILVFGTTKLSDKHYTFHPHHSAMYKAFKIIPYAVRSKTLPIAMFVYLRTGFCLVGDSWTSPLKTEPTNLSASSSVTSSLYKANLPRRGL